MTPPKYRKVINKLDLQVSHSAGNLEWSAYAFDDINSTEIHGFISSECFRSLSKVEAHFEQGFGIFRVKLSRD